MNTISLRRCLLRTVVSAGLLASLAAGFSSTALASGRHSLTIADCIALGLPISMVGQPVPANAVLPLLGDLTSLLEPVVTPSIEPVTITTPIFPSLGEVTPLLELVVTPPIELVTTPPITPTTPTTVVPGPIAGAGLLPLVGLLAWRRWLGLASKSLRHRERGASRLRTAMRTGAASNRSRLSTIPASLRRTACEATETAG